VSEYAEVVVIKPDHSSSSHSNKSLWTPRRQQQPAIYADIVHHQAVLASNRK